MSELKKLELLCEPIKNDVQLPDFKGSHKLYHLPIKLLKFNPFNDRFAAEIHEYKRKYGSELRFDDVSQKYLIKLLIQENRAKNKNTKEDIKKKGLLKPIIVENHGIVIDGNRRLMILRDIVLDPKENKKFSNVPVIVLEEGGDMSEFRIRELETIFNIWADEPLEYNPINIYVKIIRLLENEDIEDENLKFSIVADKMGVKYTPKKINEYYKTFQTMKDYLIFLKCPGQYTLLKQRIDHFGIIRKFMQNTEDGIINIDYSMNSSDFFNKNQIRKIVYYLTSILWEGKAFRKILPTQKRQGLLSFKKNVDFLWNEMKEIDLEEHCLKNPSQILSDTNKLNRLKETIRKLSSTTTVEFDVLKLVETIEKKTFSLERIETEIDSDFQNRLKMIISKLQKIVINNDK